MKNKYKYYSFFDLEKNRERKESMKDLAFAFCVAVVISLVIWLGVFGVRKIVGQFCQNTERGINRK
ncbi:MAG: hypothetical protein AAB404_01070 [Patescibacteria group bacterium]